MAVVMQYSAVALLRMLSGDCSNRNSKCPTDMKISATPWRKYWGTNQNTLIGIMAFGSSKRLNLAAADFLFISIRAATTVAMMLMTKPIPILCRLVIPEGFPVNLRAKGTKTRSYKTTPDIMVSTLKMDILAGEISKEGERWRSIERACRITKLWRCDEEVISRIPDAHIGSILMIDFSSSTLWTVTNFHKSGVADESLASSSVTIAALSNHLQIQE